MKEELEKELKDLHRINDELNDAKNRLLKVFSEILEGCIFPAKNSCKLITYPVEVDDDEQSYIGIIVSIESSTIDMETLLSIKEAVGAIKIKVLSVTDRAPFGENCYSHIELNVFLPHI